MPRSQTQNLTDSPKPRTDVRASYKKAKGEWVLVGVNDGRGAWIEIDDQHVYPLEDLE